MRTLRDPVLECSWEVTLPVYNSWEERDRVKKINPRLINAPYPLTRDFLNSYFDNTKFNFSGYSSFIRDCSASMYSYFVMSFGYTPGTTTGGSGALPAIPGGAGISYGLNKFFGLFDLNSPILWILILIIGGVAIKKAVD
jgi:hypothetical protein